MSIDTSEDKPRLMECLPNQIKHFDPITEYHAAFSQQDVIFSSREGVMTCLFLGLRLAPAAARSCFRFPNNASTLAEGRSHGLAEPEPSELADWEADKPFLPRKSACRFVFDDPCSEVAQLTHMESWPSA